MADPIYMVFCHRYPEPLDGLESGMLQKDLNPEVEKNSFDGKTYSGHRIGYANLDFVWDMSDKVLLGDFIYVVRAPFDDAADRFGAALRNFRRRNLVDLRGEVVWQGFVTNLGWTQTIQPEAPGFTSTFRIVVKDVGVLLSDSSLFGFDVIKPGGSRKNNIAQDRHFRNQLLKDYDIDINRRVYKREDIVNKLVRGFIKKRLKGRGGLLSGELFARLEGHSASQMLGLKFDAAIDADDYVSPSDVFSYRLPDKSISQYLTELCSQPFYEFFIRENTGQVVFRRSAWNKVGSLASKIANIVSGGAAQNWKALDRFDNNLLKRGQSALHKLDDADLTHVHIEKTDSTVKNALIYEHKGSKGYISRLDDEYLNRFGLRTGVVSSPQNYHPKLHRSWIQRTPAEFSPQNLTDEMLRRQLADIFRGKITLRHYLPISIGDHVKLSDSNVFDTLGALNSKFTTGFKDYTARPEDFTFYVTSKKLQFSVAGNGGRFTETMYLSVNYGGLEFVDKNSPFGFKVLHK